jgi:hypothetical protein
MVISFESLRQMSTQEKHQPSHRRSVKRFRDDRGAPLQDAAGVVRPVPRERARATRLGVCAAPNLRRPVLQVERMPLEVLIPAADV